MTPCASNGWKGGGEGSAATTDLFREVEQERASHKLGYGTALFVAEGQNVKRGDKLFEWDPYTLPIIAEKSGTTKFVDLVSGIAVRDETDDATGMTQKIVIDWRAAPKGNDLKLWCIFSGT